MAAAAASRNSYGTVGGCESHNRVGCERCEAAKLAELAPPAFTIEKEWDGNECETEDGNGRIHVSAGRWQWVLVVDGVVDSAHDSRRDARHRAAQLGLVAEAGR